MSFETIGVWSTVLFLQIPIVDSELRKAAGEKEGMAVTGCYELLVR